MITLTCTKCQNTMSIDDGFAGGVCRCQNCGTIQTVPSKARLAASGSVATGAKALYHSKIHGGGSSGLSALAEGAGGSSGLARGELAAGNGSATATSAPPRTRSQREGAAAGSDPNRKVLILLLAGGGGFLVLIFGAIIVLLLMGDNNKPPVKPVGGDVRNVSPPTPQRITGLDLTGGLTKPTGGPAFCGTKLGGSVVIYVVDRPTSMGKDNFDSLMKAVYRSIESLGTDRKFQIVFWSGTERWTPNAMYPVAGPLYATPGAVAAAKRALGSVKFESQTFPRTAVNVALASHPDTVVLATTRTDVGDDVIAPLLAAARDNDQTKFVCVNLGGHSNSSGPLKKLADLSHGTFRELSTNDLRSFAQ